MEVVNWLMENYGKIAALLISLIGVAEGVVRLTPTTKDDGAVERIGGFIKKALDMIKFPNMKK